MSQYVLLRDLAIIFAGSLLVILAFYRLRLPALPGFIVAGVLLGPNALGLVSDARQVESLAEVGVILLLFTIGIEFSLSRLREMGRQVVVGGGSAFYGDATREEILRALGAERARMLVVAISDPAATRRMVRVARSLHQRIHIIARTRYVVEIPELTRLGANVVIPEEFETSIEIFAQVRTHYGVARAEIERLVDQIRSSHYEVLRGGAAGRLSLEGVVGVPQMAVERMGLSAHSALAGKRLSATGLRSQTGALVLSVVRGTEELATPGPRFRLAAGDILVVVGQPHQLQAAARLVVGESAASPQPQTW